MTLPSRDFAVSQQLAALDPAQVEYATQFVDLLLAAARELGASDVHLQPQAQGLDVRWRIDGVLQSIGEFPSGQVADVVTRLKVLAELLTYRTDIPQEGRLRQPADQVEMRVSTYPTLHGERAVVRLFAAEGKFLLPADLGLPSEILGQLTNLLTETSGAILVTGPAGSGKTTTAYSAIRHLVSQSGGGKSIVSLEDPVEVALRGVAQSQVNQAAGFDLATGLRSLMRQDPEVILVGEIRDRETAETAFQASLTGHLVITTFHAGSAAAAISRLCDMGLEPFLLRSGILAILSQRLVRQLCTCAEPIQEAEAFLGLPVTKGQEPKGCPECHGTGYRGRLLLVEMLQASPTELGRAILSRSDAAQLESLALRGGMVSRWQRAWDAVEQGRTSPEEVRRVLGFGEPPTPRS